MNDFELAEWQNQWRGADTVPADLRMRVEREIRWRRYAFLPPLVVTLLFGGGAIVWAIGAAQPRVVVLASAVWIFIAITWATARTIAERTGQAEVPEASTTKAFLEFAIRTCRGRRAAFAAGAALYALFLVFVLVWRYQTGDSPGVGAYLRSNHVSATAAVTLVLGGLAARRYRRLGIELENLRAMQRRLENQVAIT